MYLQLNKYIWEEETEGDQSVKAHYCLCKQLNQINVPFSSF